MRCNVKGFLKYWGPPIVFAVITFFLSSKSSIKICPEIPHIDKLYHTIIYFIFAILLWRAFYFASSPSLQKRAIWFALLLTIIFGMSDEWHQMFVAFRHADIFDLLFDSLGASMAIIGVSWWHYGQKTEERELDQEGYSI